jgi:hypothetical protein
VTRPTRPSRALRAVPFTTAMLFVSAVGGALAFAGRAASSAPAPAAPAQQKIVDDVNPRSPMTPLKVDLRPYWCPICLKEGLYKEKLPPGVAQPPPPKPPADFTFVHHTPEELAQQLELGNEWMAIQTPHFKIFSTLGPTTSKFSDSIFCKADLERLKTITPKISFVPDGATLDAHQRLHLYQIRVERLYAHFMALTGNQKPNLGMPQMYELYLFSDYAHHHAFVQRYVGSSNDKIGIQWHYMIKGKPDLDLLLFTTSESQVMQNGKAGKSDGALANHVFHNVAHNLIDGYNNFFRETPAWIEEGLGHYYERRENPRWNNFCWAEGAAPAMFEQPDWEATIYSIVRRGKDVPLENWCNKLQPGELTAVENGLTWGIMKWVVETEPLKFTKMIEPMDDLKLNLDSNGLIQEGFGCTASVLYQRWREWVLKNWAGK